MKIGRRHIHYTGWWVAGGLFALLSVFYFFYYTKFVRMLPTTPLGFRPWVIQEQWLKLSFTVYLGYLSLVCLLIGHFGKRIFKNRNLLISAIFIVQLLAWPHVRLMVLEEACRDQNSVWDARYFRCNERVVVVE